MGLAHMDKYTRAKLTCMLVGILLGVHLFIAVASVITASVLIAIQLRACRFIQEYYIPEYLLLGSNAILIVVSIYGLVSTYKGKNVYNLRRFVILLCGVMILDAVSAILAASNQVTFEASLQGHLVNSLLNYGKRPDRECWDTIQRKFNCCGRDGYSDWTGNNFIPDQTIPDSCQCIDKAGNCTMVPGSSQPIYAQGCVEPLVTDQRLHMTIVTILPPVIIFILGMIFIFISYMTSRVQTRTAVDVYVVNTEDVNLQT